MQFIQYSQAGYLSAENKPDLDHGSQVKIWCDLLETDADKYRELLQTFEVDEFALSLLLSQKSRSRCIAMDAAIFLSVKALHSNSADQVDLERIQFILKDDVLISVQEKPGDSFDEVRLRLQQSLQFRNRDVLYLLYVLLNNVLDQYADELETLAQRHANFPKGIDIQHYEELKSKLYFLRRPLSSFREAMNQMQVLTKLKHAKYFQELKEQSTYVIDGIDLELQLLESKTNLFFSQQGNRLNEVMKTLTIFSVVFIPLTFIAGIYGMNFEYMPELKYRYSYFIVLGIMGLLVLLILWLFRRMKWF